jgi:hypothetical protein
MTATATFYTVTDAGFFPGTVALLNSLRLVGHDEPLIVLDNGLTESQRERLDQFVSIVDVPRDSTSIAPPALKPFPYLVGATGTVVFVDSDMIVSASLAPLFALAAKGQICLFPDNPYQRERWFPEWQEMFSLHDLPRRQTYLNSGLVVFSVDHWPRLLEKWSAACSLVPAEVMFKVEDHPLGYGDQDALNAILMSEIDAESITVLPYEGVSGPDDRPVKIVSGDRLICMRDDLRISVLHHWDRPKVWCPSRAGRRRMSLPEPYIRLFPRVVFGEDVTLQLSPSDVPWWLRPGPRHELALRHQRALAASTRAKRVAIGVAGAQGRRVRRVIGRRVRRALIDRRLRRA